MSGGTGFHPSGGGGGGGTTNYDNLSNKPSINSVTLQGNVELGGVMSDAVYQHTQETPSAVWEIEHNLGFLYVSVLIFDSDNDEAIGTVDWPASTKNKLVVNFGIPLSGRAYVRL
jgi:hypothetical protein